MQPNQSHQTSCRHLPRRPRGPVGYQARRAWRIGHRCHTCSAESGRTEMGCCRNPEVAIESPSSRISPGWDVLSEFDVSEPDMSVFRVSILHTLSTGSDCPSASSSVLRLRFLVGAACIVTGVACMVGGDCGKAERWKKMFCSDCDDEKASVRLQMGAAGSQGQLWHGKHAEQQVKGRGSEVGC
jgi:hypothetical protein